MELCFLLGDGHLQRLQQEQPDQVRQSSEVRVSQCGSPKHLVSLLAGNHSAFVGNFNNQCEVKGMSKQS